MVFAGVCRCGLEAPPSSIPPKLNPGKMEHPPKRTKLNNNTNNYSGYTLLQSNAPLTHLTSPPDPKEFFHAFIKTRRPCVIPSQIATTTTTTTGFQQWSSNDYLKATAGDATVRVEIRTKHGTAYGQGHYETMTFSSFLSLLEQGSTSHYLTTQDIDVDEEGRPALMSSPCIELSRDFPLVPALAGHLIPMNINIWMGNSTTTDGGQPTSSGLHHDFHDNLYVLLRGKKKFRLFSPADATKLHTQGAIQMVHPNGRICYEHELTNADGSTDEARQAMEASEAMDAATIELEQAEASVEKGEPGSQARLARAEERMDLAMERTMDFEMMNGNGDEEEEEEYEGEMWGNTGLAMSDGKNGDSGGRKSDKDEEEDEDQNEDGGRDQGTEGKETAMPMDNTDTPEPAPKHFSQIDMSRKDRMDLWPGLKTATMTEVELNAGDMLYLPAGWFHEVLSETTRDNDGHMAFNYWFHPPDGETFDAPYASTFWSKDWLRQATHQQHSL